MKSALADCRLCRIGLLAVLLCFGAAVSAQASVSITLKWKARFVGNEDVMLARLVDGKVETHSARTDADAKVTFKDVAAGDWTCLAAVAARAQAKLKERVLGGFIGKPIALKAGDNQFEINMGEYGLTQVEMKVAWPEVVDFGQCELLPLGWGLVIPMQENSLLYLAWPGPHRIEYTVGIKREANAIDGARSFLFEQAVSIPEEPSCVIEPAIKFSRLKLKWKLPAKAKQASVETWLVPVLPPRRSNFAEVNSFTSPAGTSEKDCGLNPDGRYALYAVATTADGRWHVRRDVELANTEETIDLDFTAGNGALDGTIKLEGEGWDNVEERIIDLRLTREGKPTQSVTVRVAARRDFKFEGLSPGEWKYEATGNGCLPGSGSIEVKAAKTTKLEIVLKHCAGILVSVSGYTWASYRWEFEAEDGRRLMPETADGATGVPNRLGDGVSILIYAIPRGTVRIRFLVIGKADILLQVHDRPGKLQSGQIEIPEE